MPPGRAVAGEGGGGAPSSAVLPRCRHQMSEAMTDVVVGVVRVPLPLRRLQSRCVRRQFARS